MAEKIKITPEELQAQATEMKALEGEFSALFSGVSSDLKQVNANWSPNLSHNFEGKINSAQSSFAQITQELMNGAKVADTCAVTFHSIDSELSKLYHPELSGSAATLWDMIKEEISDIPEDAKYAGKALAWIEKQYGKLPDWITHGVDVLAPGSLKDAYTLASGILQGDLTPQEGWKVAKHILVAGSKGIELAAILETVEYVFDTGIAKTIEMQEEMDRQASEGDILGVVFDGAEGMIDLLIGGPIEILGNAVGGYVDSKINNIPVVKASNLLTEYNTGLLGWNEGDGYSVGGLIGHATEKVSEGIDAITDVITDATDVVTDTVTEGVKTGINWVKSWLD